MLLVSAVNIALISNDARDDCAKYTIHIKSTSSPHLAESHFVIFFFFLHS